MNKKINTLLEVVRGELSEKRLGKLGIKIHQSRHGPHAIQVELLGKVGRVEVAGRSHTIYLTSVSEPKWADVADSLVINRAEGGPVPGTTKFNITRAVYDEVMSHWERHVKR